MFAIVSCRHPALYMSSSGACPKADACPTSAALATQGWSGVSCLFYVVQVKWGIDLSSEHERYLAERVFKSPVIVYNYPKDIKVPCQLLSIPHIHAADRSTALAELYTARPGSCIGICNPFFLSVSVCITVSMFLSLHICRAVAACHR